MSKHEPNEILTLVLTEAQKAWCEDELKTWTVLEQKLTAEKAKYHELALRAMLKYEITTRQRKEVINRLCGRHAKLKRARVYEELMTFTKNYTAQPVTTFEKVDHGPDTGEGY